MRCKRSFSIRNKQTNSDISNMYTTLAEKAAQITLLGEYIPCILAFVILKHAVYRAKEPSCWCPGMLVKVKDEGRPALNKKTLDQLQQIATRPLKDFMLNSWPENDEISVLFP